MPVPQKFSSLHDQIIATLGRGSLLYDALAKMKEDPILSLASLEAVPDFMASMLQISNDTNSALTANNLKIKIHPQIITNAKEKQ